MVLSNALNVFMLKPDGSPLRFLPVDAILAVIVALADSSVESGSPRQVPDRQERDRGFHAHAGPQQEL